MRGISVKNSECFDIVFAKSKINWQMEKQAEKTATEEQPKNGVTCNKTFWKLTRKIHCYSQEYLCWPLCPPSGYYFPGKLVCCFPTLSPEIYIAFEFPTLFHYPFYWQTDTFLAQAFEYIFAPIAKNLWQFMTLFAISHTPFCSTKNNDFSIFCGFRICHALFHH